MSKYIGGQSKGGRGKMLRDNKRGTQGSYELVLLEELIPLDHILGSSPNSVEVVE